jgi:hypothetical protein
MSYKVRQQELVNVSALTPEKRYGYFINKVADWAEVWGIRDDEGWSSPLDNQNAACMAVWPAEAFAKQCCVGEWESRHPESIALDEWRDHWLPGMSRDGLKIAVFPVPPLTPLTAVVVSPQRLADDLKEACVQLGDDDEG